MIQHVLDNLLLNLDTLYDKCLFINAEIKKINLVYIKPSCFLPSRLITRYLHIPRYLTTYVAAVKLLDDRIV